jgi:cbb3-type cytochrome oxidase maturation protein
MDAATIGLTIVTGTVGLVFLGLLIWGIKSGQFHNVEEAKYQVFRKQKDDREQDPGEGERREVKSDAKP